MTVYAERSAVPTGQRIAGDWQLVVAARAALDAHAAFETTHDIEPCPNRDEATWTRWHHEVHLPAHHTWQATLDCLEVLVGEAFPGRQGPAWFALCLRILTAEGRGARIGTGTRQRPVADRDQQPHRPPIASRRIPERLPECAARASRLQRTTAGRVIE